MNTLRSRSLAIALLAASFSCRDGSAPLNGVFVIAAPAADTVIARPLQALTLAVRVDGAPAGGRQVVLQSILNNDNVAVLMTPLTSQNFTYLTYLTTGDDGNISVKLAMGSGAGTARVVVSVPELSLIDTLSFTIKPGAAKGVRFRVRDTTISIGEIFVPMAARADQFNNVRSEAVPYSNTTPTVCRYWPKWVEASEIGRCVFTTSYNGFVDTARASIVPPARLAIVRLPSFGLVNANGAAFKKLISASDGSLAPAWSDDGSRLVIYEGNPSDSSTLSILDTLGNRIIKIGWGNKMNSAYFGRFTHDGKWVIFSGKAAYSDLDGIWRMPANGGAVTKLMDAPVFSFGAAHRVSISPDDASIAFDAGFDLAVLNVATQAVTKLNVEGSTPAFSPDGSKIAYLGFGGGGLYVIDKNGANKRIITPQGFEVWCSPQWTPDSKWIVAQGLDRLVLVRVSDGLVLPLSYGGQAAMRFK